MTPFASVAMLEKLALLKIALCRAPALSSASSACLRNVRSPAPLETPIPVLLVAAFWLAAVLPPVTGARSRGLRLRSVRDEGGMAPLGGLVMVLRDASSEGSFSERALACSHLGIAIRLRKGSRKKKSASVQSPLNG